MMSVDNNSEIEEEYIRIKMYYVDSAAVAGVALVFISTTSRIGNTGGTYVTCRTSSAAVSVNYITTTSTNATMMGG
jgi:hypothetical protein